MAFTDKGVKALEPKASAYRIYEKGSDPGFCIRITPAGTKTFQLAYKAGGRQRFLRLGTYPATSLAKAREEARSARSLIDQGIDPQAERERIEKEKEAAAVTYGSVKQLFDHYLEVLEQQGRGVDEVRRSLEKDALPKLGEDTPAREITAEQIAKVLHKVHKRGARSMANHLRRYLHRAFQLGLHHDNDPRNMGAEIKFGIPFNPVSNVPHDTEADRAGERELSWQEMRSVWFALDDHCSPAQSAAARIIMCSGLRVMEVIHAELAEIDLDQMLWRIPAARIKTRIKRRADHLVPITSLMADEIRRAMTIAGPRSRFLFPAHNNPRATRPMHDTSLSHAIANMCKESGIARFAPRDLRRTWKTRGGELGIPMEHRNHVQNHAKSDVASVHYDVWTYLDEKRGALQSFCDHLHAVLKAEDGKVVPIRRNATVAS